MSDAKAKIIDDLTRVLSGAGATAQAMREEMETLIRGRVERVLNEHGVVTRDEFEALRDVVLQMRAEMDEQKK